MPIKIGMVLLLIAGIGFFVFSKFSPSQQVPSFIPNISQQTSQKELTSHEMPTLLEIEVKNGVDKDDEKKMREGFNIMDFYLNQLFDHSITKKSTIKIEDSSDDSRFVKEADRYVFYYRTRSRDWLLPKQMGDNVRSLETYSSGGGGGGGLDNVYPYFALAVDFLTKNRDIKTLDDFCVNLGKGQELSVAFQNAFGILLTKFYGDFEAYFTQTFSKPVKEGGGAPPSVDKESQIPQGYSSWADFCKVKPKDSRCTTNKP